MNFRVMFPAMILACLCLWCVQSSFADESDLSLVDGLDGQEEQSERLLEKGLIAYNQGDFKTAYKLTIPYARDGHPVALNLLGMMYELGQGVNQDTQKSIVYYRQAADKGDLYAQFNLGVSYDSGKGVPQNFREAVKWYKRAAIQGASFAQYNLAIMYEQGRGVQKSFEEAVYWYNKAALQGDSKAQNNLAYLYESGKGVNKDLVKAYVLFDNASKQGIEPAFYKREEIKMSMSKDQLTQANIETIKYREKYTK